MKKEIKNTTILEKTVRPENGKILKRVQDDMGWFRYCFGALAPDKNFSLLTFHFSQKAAFTLAEVLITLGIIGVVAAMTMPSLIQKYQEKATVTALKKFYSAIQQAYQFAVAEYGTPDSWVFSNSDSEVFISYIAPHMKFTKICTTGEKCHPSDDLYERNGTKTNNAVFNPISKQRWAAQLADGMIIGTYAYSDNCALVRGTSKQLANICGEYMVDINGGKKPNQYGKDVFIFNLTKYGIIPMGSAEEAIYQISPSSFENACLPKSSTGWSCAGWVISNENLDYLHCDDLSWDGKHKCTD